MKRNKLAFVMSGGFIKGVAHIPIAKGMYKRGYVPDDLVGSSIGAVIAVLLGLYDDPEKVEKPVLDFVGKHIWPQLLSVDIFSKAGLFESKEAVRLIAKEAGFAGKTFSDLKKPVYITATDLNTGKLVVFGGERRTVARLETSCGKGHACRISTDEYRFQSRNRNRMTQTTIEESLEAAISFPVIFKPKKLKIGGKVMALADGGIRENCPISVAAKLPGVNRIIACDLGYCGQLKGDFNKKSAAEVFMQCLELTTSFSQINRYINDDIFIKKNISVRIVNPGIFDVFPFDLKEIPSVMKRSSKTAKIIFGRFKTPKAFFHAWRSDPYRRQYMTVEHIGRKRTNAWEIIDFDIHPDK